MTFDDWYETYERDGGELMLFNSLDMEAAYKAGYAEAEKVAILRDTQHEYKKEVQELRAEVERLTNYITDRLSPVVDVAAKASNEGCLVLDCGGYSLELGYEASRAIADLQAKLTDSVSQATHNFAVRKAEEYLAKLDDQEAYIKTMSAYLIKQTDKIIKYEGVCPVCQVNTPFGDLTTCIECAEKLDKLAIYEDAVEVKDCEIQRYSSTKPDGWLVGMFVPKELIGQQVKILILKGEGK